MMTAGTVLEDSGRRLEIVKHIGKGKGGDSYLAKHEGRNVVFKAMHYEPCDTYAFEGNKLQAELRDYGILKSAGIAIPSLLYHNDEKQFLVKEYADGKTVAQLVGEDALKDEYVRQMFDMCGLLYAKNLNVDYFPTNFVVANERLLYIDFECNPYMEEWDFEHWGIYFWANTRGMVKFLETGDHQYLSINAKPHKAGLEEKVMRYMRLNPLYTGGKTDV